MRDPICNLFQGALIQTFDFPENLSLILVTEIKASQLLPCLRHPHSPLLKSSYKASLLSFQQTIIMCLQMQGPSGSGPEIQDKKEVTLAFKKLEFCWRKERRN